MAIIASDDFSGVGTGSIVGRTLNNALGGSVSAAYVSSSNPFFGSGATNKIGAGNASAISLAPIAGAKKARIRVDPSGGASNMALWAMRDVGEWNTGNGMLLLLAGGHTSLRAASISSGARTDHQTLSITAPGALFWMEVEIDTSAKTLTCRILNDDTSVRNTVSHTFTTLPIGGDYWGIGFYQDGQTGIFDDFIVDDGAAADTTAPTLTSATATATSATTANGGVTTDEAGPAWAVLTTSSTTPSAAQIKAGQSHTGAAASASDTATLSVGANSGVFDFTGLTGGQTYWLHVVQDDAVPNTSTPITSASSITTPTPDTTAPTMNGSITVGAKTSSTIDISWPAGSDDTAVVAYDVRINGGSWIDNGLALTYSASGLDALTSYTFEVTARDAAGNRSTPALSVTTSTYRDGALASTILLLTGPQGGNPAGFLYDFASTVATSAWLSYTIVSGPTPAGGSLDANAMGAFSYTGPAPATMVIQPEVNGANAPETITVTLYDNSVSLGAASMASTPTYGSGPVSQAAPVPLTGTAVAVASAYGSGQIAQGAPVVLAGAAFAVIPAMGAGGLMQGVPVALSAASFVVTPVFSAGALSQAAPVVLMGAALSVSTAYGPGAISDAPTFTSLAPSPVCTTYRRDSYPAHTFQKLAGETLDFDIDFRYELRCTQDSARIQDPVEIQAGQGVEVLGAYWVPGLRRVKMWVTGGESQGRSDISIWLNTEAGRRLQVDVRVQIK